jgi:hypothetical protein
MLETTIAGMQICASQLPENLPQTTEEAFF